MTRVLRTWAVLILLAAASCAGQGGPSAATGARARGRAVPLADRKAAERALRSSPLAQLFGRCAPGAVDIILPAAGAPEGSGSIIHERGYILTCEHVPVEGAVITLFDGKQYRARKIIQVPGLDAAIGKIEPETPLPILPLGRSAGVKVGDPVIAIGSPARFSFSASSGAVNGQAAGQFHVNNMHIGPGSSGGPLIDSSGRQIGLIWTAVFTWTAAQACTIDRIRQAIPQEISERKLGVWMGLAVDPMSEGTITEVKPASPADKAGLRAGDVLTRMGNFRIRDGIDYYLCLTERKPLEQVAVGFRRGTETLTVQMTTGAFTPVNALTLRAAPGSKSVAVSWAGPVEPFVTAIEVYRGEGQNGALQKIGEVTDLAKSWYVDKNVKLGTEYRYTVRPRSREGLFGEYCKPVAASPAQYAYLKRINCGGPEVPSDDGTPWEADKGSKGNAALTSRGTNTWTVTSRVNGTGPAQDVYQAERWANQYIEYAFNVEPGRYEVVLHFAETSPSFFGKGKRTFDIIINGQKAAEKVDLFALAGGPMISWQFQKAIQVTGRQLTVRVQGNPTGPAIKGIEIRGLVPKP